MPVSRFGPMISRAGQELPYELRKAFVLVSGCDGGARDRLLSLLFLRPVRLSSLGDLFVRQVYRRSRLCR